MLRLKPFLVLLTISCASAQVRSSSEQSEALAINRGYWSGKAVSLFNTVRAVSPVPGRELSLYSPDHSKLVGVHAQKVSIFVEKQEFPTDFWDKTAAELGWSPD